MGLMEPDENFIKQWGLKWAEGVILGFVKGKVTFSRAVGMLRSSKKYGVTNGELDGIMNAIESNPAYYLPAMTADEKASKLSLLRNALKN